MFKVGQEVRVDKSKINVYLEETITEFGEILKCHKILRTVYIKFKNDKCQWINIEAIEIYNRPKSTIIKAIDKDISVLENAKRKHNSKIVRINEQIEMLKEKKDKHLIEETKIDVTLEEIIKDYEERNKCKVNVTKESK